MKKRLIIEIISGLLLFTVGIFIGSFYATNRISKSAANQEIITNSAQSMDSKKEVSTNIEENKTIKLNEPFEVKTEYGSYNFTIKSAINTNWLKDYYGKDNQKVILLNLECENIDFSNENHKGVLLANAFIVKDNNNFTLKRSEFDYNRAESGIHEIPKNSKSRISMPYVAESDINSISIEFNRGGIIKDIPITG